MSRSSCNLWHHLASVNRDPHRLISEIPGRRSVSPLHGTKKDRQRRKLEREKIK